MNIATAVFVILHGVGLKSAMINSEGGRLRVSHQKHFEVSRQTVTMAINGTTQPMLALTLAVANALGVPVEEIAERTPDLKFPKGGGRSSGQQRPSMMAPMLAPSA